MSASSSWREGADLEIAVRMSIQVLEAEEVDHRMEIDLHLCRIHRVATREEEQARSVALEDKDRRRHNTASQLMESALT